MTEPRQQDDLWARFAEEVRSGRPVPFEEQWARFGEIYAGRPPEAGPPLVWRPTAEGIARSNLGRFQAELGFAGYPELHAFSAGDRAGFWGEAAARVGYVFRRPAASVLDLAGGPTDPRWFPGAELNASESCFRGDPGRPAVVAGREGSEEITTTSLGELRRLAARVAHGLRGVGLEPGDGVALVMPMTLECVAAYLGAVAAGCPVVSIADSFSAAEVARRLEIARPRLAVTVDRFRRGGRSIALYERLRQAGAPPTTVMPGDGSGEPCRPGDLRWRDLLGADAPFSPEVGDPERTTNILFSSGTTARPKAIPWTHLTPLKCVVDAHFHQDVRPGDRVAWPTNIGWMMGPWLIYASLANGASMALYDGAPNGSGFLRFVEAAGVTVLGVVPSLVRAWRAAEAARGSELAGVRVLSSTGEPSSREDYLWLMSLTGYRAPVIEYCGGTEIGGGHLTGTVVQPASPTVFTTPALGIDVVVLDEAGRPAAEGESGELFVVPPSVGLSQELLDRDHDAVYYEGCPRGPHGEVLRRHGDRVRRLPGGLFRAEGRADDAMNLGGIKISSLELERALGHHPAVYECAAVGVRPGGEGAERLVVFAVPEPSWGEVERGPLAAELGALIAREVNPLFKLHDLVLVERLPRTASNKIVRRALRDRYLDSETAGETQA